MPSIELCNIEKNICHGLHLQVFDAEMLVLVGPTGGGKTTILNVIAGITEYKGSVLLDGKVVDSLAPDKRGVGYLFQDLALFPHLDVATNIEYGLKMQNMEPARRKARVQDLLEMLNIAHLQRRYPRGLSGGEQQRVALARALAPSPGILLLDEPMSSLDPTTSKYLRIELKKILKEMEVTVVYVTHNMMEAEEMADRMALIYNGHIQQVSSPRDMIFSPCNNTVSNFIGMPNILECQYSKVLDYGLVELKSGDMTLLLPHDGNSIKKVAIFPSDIYISNVKPPGSKVNRFMGTVINVDVYLSVARVKVTVHNKLLLAELPLETCKEMGLKSGQDVFVVIKLRRIRYVETES
jgi:ABC-type Fe3+/spermidine/putrescine transport system ATPase subunit